MAPVLYYKDPGTSDWIPFGTTDPVADEVQTTVVEPGDPLVDLWIDPSGTGSDVDWPQFDARYVDKRDPAGDTMAGPLTVAAPVGQMDAATKQYVDTTMHMVTNATIAAHMPVASIAMFAGKYLPPGWHHCDGKPHNSWALQSALDSPNTPLIPAGKYFGYIIYGGS